MNQDSDIFSMFEFVLLHNRSRGDTCFQFWLGVVVNVGCLMMLLDMCVIMNIDDR